MIIELLAEIIFFKVFFLPSENKIRVEITYSSGFHGKNGEGFGGMFLFILEFT